MIVLIPVCENSLFLISLMEEDTFSAVLCAFIANVNKRRCSKLRPKNSCSDSSKWVKSSVCFIWSEEKNDHPPCLLWLADATSVNEATRAADLCNPASTIFCLHLSVGLRRSLMWCDVAWLPSNQPLVWVTGESREISALLNNTHTGRGGQ